MIILAASPKLVNFTDRLSSECNQGTIGSIIPLKVQLVPFF